MINVQSSHERQKTAAAAVQLSVKSLQSALKSALADGFQALADAAPTIQRSAIAPRLK